MRSNLPIGAKTVKIKCSQMMDIYDNFPPYVRKLIQDAPIRVGIMRIYKAVNKWDARMTERAITARVKKAIHENIEILEKQIESNNNG